MRNKFKINESVFYPHVNRYGTIKNIINKDDPADVATQGYRYEVFFDHKGCWSILEKSLFRRKKDEEGTIQSKSAAIAKA